MAKKKKAEEHENLERWLVSYADFMTLLFATFVVLYALAQTETQYFQNLEEALKEAFAKSGSLIEGQAGMLAGAGTDALMDGANSQGRDANPLMLEYISAKYEDSAYEEIQEELKSLKLTGITSVVDNKGITIKLPESIIDFAPNSAKLSDRSKNLLFDIGNIIFKRFQIHLIRVEGHTDSSKPPKNGIYPSNWELSSARASSVINFFIDEMNANPKQFVAVGYSDTVPDTGLKPENVKNRRVEIVVIRNRIKNNHSNDLLSILKKNQKTNYVRYNYAKKDAANLLENKPLAPKEDYEATKESKEIKNLYEKENKRLKKEEEGYSSAPAFVKNNDESKEKPKK